MNRMRIAGVAVAATVALAAGTVAFAAASGPVSSTFSKGTLNSSIWHVIGQDANLSMTAHSGWLTIKTQTLGVANYGTGLKDMVLQSADPTANWTVSVETTYFGIKFGPAGTLANYQGGGIYAFQDNTDWVRMQRQASNCTLALQADDGTWGSQTGITYGNGQTLPTNTVTENSASGTPAYTVACDNSADPLWLRLTKVGTVYTGYYSTDGSNWVQTESFAWPTLKPAYVGVTANEGGGTATPIDFGFKNFEATSATASGAASSASSSTPKATSSSAPASTPAASGASSVPKTGASPLVAMLGLLLALAGGTAALGLRLRHGRS